MQSEWLQPERLPPLVDFFTAVTQILDSRLPGCARPAVRIVAEQSPRASCYPTQRFHERYFVLGLPDTMLSFALHNTLYVVLTAMLLNYCRDARV